MSKRRIRIGGLFRCCIETVREYDGPEVPGETVVTCGACGDKVRLAPDGIWEWDH